LDKTAFAILSLLLSSSAENQSQQRPKGTVRGQSFKGLFLWARADANVVIFSVSK